MNTFLKTQKGLTLIEVMIALVLGVLLLGGTISMFIANKRIYKEQESMARLQENARFGIDILMQNIRMSGYTGCSDDMDNVANHVNGATGANILSFDMAVEGLESGGNWQPSNSTDVVSDICSKPIASSDNVGCLVQDTDGVTARYMDDTGLEIQSPFMPTTSAALHVLADNGLVEGEIVGVSDCDSADVFQITNSDPDTSGTVAHNTGTGTPGNSTKDLQKKYLADAAIVKFISRRYYIGKGAYGGPSLFRNHFAQDREDSDGDGNTDEVIQHSQELIEGVENMQILYGVDTTNDKVADTYLDAGAVAGGGGWDNVISVRLALLFRTIEVNRQIERDNATYTLLGGAPGGITIANPNDQHRRRVFTVTVQIRNRSI